TRCLAPRRWYLVRGTRGPLRLVTSLDRGARRRSELVTRCLAPRSSTSFKARGFDRSTFQISRDPLARTSAERDPESEMRESETALPAGVPEAEPAVQCPSRLSFDEGSGAGFGRSVRASRRSNGNRRESP